MPKLLKLECEGSIMIILFSKLYYVEEQDSEKRKFSAKGMLTRQNNITWQRFQARAEIGHSPVGISYGQKTVGHLRAAKLGLSAYSDKLWVLPDKIHTEPHECHMTRAAGNCVLRGTTNSSPRASVLVTARSSV